MINVQMKIPKLLHEECARKMEVVHVKNTGISFLFGRPLQPTLVEIPAALGVRIFFEALSHRCLEVPAQPAVAHILVHGHEHTDTSLADTDHDYWRNGKMQGWSPVGSPQYRPQRERTGSSCSTAATLTPF